MGWCPARSPLGWRSDGSGRMGRMAGRIGWMYGWTDEALVSYVWAFICIGFLSFLLFFVCSGFGFSFSCWFSFSFWFPFFICVYKRHSVFVLFLF